MNRMDYHTAALDADVTRPSIPRAFGIRVKARMRDVELLPVKTPTGIDVMFANLLLENDADPNAWRGPLIAGTEK